MDYRPELVIAYRQAVQGKSSTDTCAQLDEARKEAAASVAARIKDGELDGPSIASVLEAEVDKIDKSDKNQADKMIDILLYGQQDFDLDEVLDVVVTLGAGNRKPWRLITRQDIITMDELRYGNLEKQQESYKAWRPKFYALLDGWETHGSAEEILASGALLRDGAE